MSDSPPVLAILLYFVTIWIYCTVSQCHNAINYNILYTSLVDEINVFIIIIIIFIIIIIKY